MVVLQWGNDWEVHAPAKLNFHLEVLAKRNDGFHEIETLMVPVSIYDTLRFTPQATNTLHLHTRWAAGLQARHGDLLGDLPANEQNLVFRALQLLQREAGVKLGARVELIKRIPSQAGLGGASTDAAAATIGGNQKFRRVGKAFSSHSASPRLLPTITSGCCLSNSV